MPVNALIDLTLKSCVLLALAWTTASVFLRHASASARHLTWATTLIGLLVLPLVTITGPVWLIEAGPPQWIQRPLDRLTASDSAVESAPGDALSRPPVAIVASPQTSISIAVPTGPVAYRGWRTVIALIWAAGVAFAVLRLGVGFLYMTHLARRAMPVVMGSWQASLRQAADTVRIGNPVALVFSHRISVPVVCGLIRPTLLLPTEALTWNTERQQAVALHELAHIKRRDGVLQLLAQLACALHWFNPFVHAAAVRMRDEQELACDDLVLRSGIAASQYAEHLCDIVLALRGKTVVGGWAATAMARPSRRFEHRVRAILDDSRRRRPVSMVTRASVGALVCLVVLPLGAIRLSSAPGRVTAESVDLSGVWIRDAKRSDASYAWDPNGPEKIGELTITAGGSSLTLRGRRDGQPTVTVLTPDGVARRQVVTEQEVGGGRMIRGNYIETRWDGGRLVTLSTPFSTWLSSDGSEPRPEQVGGAEIVDVRRLSADGQELILERIARGTWMWAFDGKTPSDAYGRRTTVYRRQSSH